VGGRDPCAPRGVFRRVAGEHHPVRGRVHPSGSACRGGSRRCRFDRRVSSILRERLSAPAPVMIPDSTVRPRRRRWTREATIQAIDSWHANHLRPPSAERVRFVSDHTDQPWLTPTTHQRHDGLLAHPGHRRRTETSTALNLQAGGRRFEPGTLHRTKPRKSRGFVVSVGNAAGVVADKWPKLSAVTGFLAVSAGNAATSFSTRRTVCLCLITGTRHGRRWSGCVGVI
jgi:hypothetical protein